MKYQEGEILFYVNPFVFIIDKVKIEMGILEKGELFYIDSVGAYLREENLFRDFKQAQRYALDKLDEFVYNCRYQILNNKPHFGLED